jgi:hypothetical protein
MATKETPPGLGDLFTAIGGSNPFAALAKTAEQFRAGVVGFIDAVAAFKQTMDALSATTARLNRVLDDLEGPLHVLMPQITATSEQAAKVFAVMSGPVEKLGPGLAQLADTLSSPALADLPRRLNEAVEAMSVLPKTLTPLSQMAEVAGGLFGTGLRGFGGLAGIGQTATGGARRATAGTVPGRTPPDTTAPSSRPDPVVVTASASAPATSTTSATRSPARRTAPRKQTAKAASANKVPAKEARARKASAKKAAPKKAAPKSGAGSTRRRPAGGAAGA